MRRLHPPRLWAGRLDYLKSGRGGRIISKGGRSYILRFVGLWAENVLTEGQEGFKKVLGGHRIRSGRVSAQMEPGGPIREC